MADALNKPAEAQRWAKLAAGLGDYHAAKDGELMLDSKRVLRESHRHPANLMAIYPFNLITCEGSALDKQRIATTLARPEWHNPTHYEWCGYTWGWLSCLHSRVGDAEGAIRHLDVFVKAYLSRNGFHVNQDQSGQGFGAGGGRPFTLEGNFLGLQAVHEMLLQSWSPTPGRRDTEIIRIFPATPWRWHDVSFADLRAQGGQRVSARRESNGTTWLRIVAGKDGQIRIRDNFDGRTPQWNCAAIKQGENFVVIAKKGEVIEATVPKPAAIPAAPADLAEPVVVQGSSRIAVNNLPLHIGAANDGSNRFKGDMARVLVADKTFSEDEIVALADPKFMANNALPTLVDKFQPMASADVLIGKVFHFDGNGYLEIPAKAAVNGEKGLTLAAWIRPAEFPAVGMRIIDKSPVGGVQGYLLDTYPKNSLRLITHEPHLIFAAKLPLNQWTHVAATVDGQTGKLTLYINGKVVAEQ